MSRITLANSGQRKRPSQPDALAVLRRAPPNPAAKPWQMPFDLGTATTHQEAAAGLAALIGKFEELATTLGVSEATVITALTQERAAFAAGPDAPLSDHDVADVTTVGNLAASAYTGQLTRAAQEVIAALLPLRSPEDIAAANGELADALHEAYQKKDTKRIESVKAAIEGSKQWAERVKEIGVWAARITAILKLTEGLSAAAAEWKEIYDHLKGNSELTEAVEKAINVIDTANAVAKAAGDESGSMEKTIDSFSAAMKGIDVGLTFVKAVPIFGQLWSQWYMPMTQACLAGIAKLNAQTNKDRQFYTMFAGDGDPPTIEPANLDAFPGGQPVFNYMYALVNRKTATLTEPARKYFIANRERLGIGEDDQIEVQSHTVWYNPLTWAADDTFPNLEKWLAEHSNTVWASLYGNLPHSKEEYGSPLPL